MKIIYTYTEKNYSKDRSLISETRRTTTITFIEFMKFIKSFFGFLK